MASGVGVLDAHAFLLKLKRVSVPAAAELGIAETLPYTQFCPANLNNVCLRISILTKEVYKTRWDSAMEQKYVKSWAQAPSELCTRWIIHEEHPTLRSTQSSQLKRLL